jgi:hypothetical protein
MANPTPFSFWAIGKIHQPRKPNTQALGVELAMSPLKTRRAIFGTKAEPMTCSNPQVIGLAPEKLKIVWSNILL